MSCNFMLCNLMVRHFHVRHFQRPRRIVERDHWLSHSHTIASVTMQYNVVPA